MMTIIIIITFVIVACSILFIRIDSYGFRYYKCYNTPFCSFKVIHSKYQSKIYLTKENDQYIDKKRRRRRNEDVMDDEDDDDTDDNEEDGDIDDDDDQPNPIIRTLKKLYDTIFFYGLDESDINNSRLVNLQNTAEYRRKRNVIAKNNPFLTSSEKLGLFLIQSGEIDKMKQSMNNKDDNTGNNMKSNASTSYVEYDEDDQVNDNSFDGIDDDDDDDDLVDRHNRATMPYDSKSIQSLERYIIKLRSYIEDSSNRLQVMRVTLALKEEENDDNRADSRVDRRLEEELMDLNRDIQQLVVKINNAKIELITVSALLDTLS